MARLRNIGLDHVVSVEFDEFSGLTYVPVGGSGSSTGLQRRERGPSSKSGTTHVNGGQALGYAGECYAIKDGSY